MSDKTPEQDGYQSIVIIKQCYMSFMVDLLRWMNDEWLPDNGYDGKNAIMRNTPEGCYEIMAKPKE